LGTLKVYKCEPWESIDFGKYNGVPDSEEDTLRKVVDLESVRIRKTIDVTHVTGTPKPVIQFPARSTSVETSSIGPPQTFESVDEAKEYIVMTVGIGFDQMRPDLKKAIGNSLESIHTINGFIESSFVLLCVNKIREEQSNLRRKIGG
jgi:hypothetical protein